MMNAHRPAVIAILAAIALATAMTTMSAAAYRIPPPIHTLYPENPKGGEAKTELRVSPGLLSDTNGLVSDIGEVPVQGGWINSTPMDLDRLWKQNKLVLLEFWAYTCINCIRANAFTQALWERYKDYGLVVIGVHSLEFAVGESPANILAAVRRQGLTYPIFTDGRKLLWRYLNVYAWPAKFLVDSEGYILYFRFGEGGYAEAEEAIRKHLTKLGYQLPDYGPLDPALELIPERSSGQTPELYAGAKYAAYLRQPYGNKKQPEVGVATTFHLPSGDLDPDQLYLGGTWLGHRGNVESQTPATIAVSYQAQAAYAVMESVSGVRTVTVTLDGQPLPPDLRGKDIQMQDGHTVMMVDEPRLYWPISNSAPFARHTLKLEVPAGVRLYSFSFGTYKSTP